MDQETLERIARQTERQTRDAYLGVISEISRVQALRQALESSRTALRATEAGLPVYSIRRRAWRSAVGTSGAQVPCVSRA